MLLAAATEIPSFTAESWPHDTVRLILIAGAIFLLMIVLRVVYIRQTSPPEAQIRGRSPWGLLSYGAALAIVAYDALERFGLDLDPWRVMLQVTMILAGIGGVWADIRFRPGSWLAAGHRRAADRAEGQAAREEREDVGQAGVEERAADRAEGQAAREEREDVGTAGVDQRAADQAEGRKARKAREFAERPPDEREWPRFPPP